MRGCEILHRRYGRVRRAVASGKLRWRQERVVRAAPRSAYSADELRQPRAVLRSECHRYGDVLGGIRWSEISAGRGKCRNKKQKNKQRESLRRKTDSRCGSQQQ